MTDLLNCPFCGSRPLSATENAGLWWVSCTVCDGEQSHGTKAGVIAAWNRRASPPARKEAPAEPVSDRYKFDDEIAWLREAARYFAGRDTKGEDRAHWANVYNAENARKLADRLAELSSNTCQLEAAAEGAGDFDGLEEHLAKLEASEVYAYESRIADLESEILTLRNRTSEPEAGEAQRDAWSDFEGDHLTDGKGHATAEAYRLCRAAFDATWPHGREAAINAAVAAIHPAPATADKLKAEFLAGFAAGDDPEGYVSGEDAWNARQALAALNEGGE